MIALVNYAATLNILKNDLKKEYPRIGEAPFDSSRKMMSTVHKISNEVVQFTKGAPDEILRVCTAYTENGDVYPLTEDKRTQIHNKVRNNKD